MVRTSISNSFSATRLRNWQSVDVGGGSSLNLNPVGGYCEHSFEELAEARPKPARELRAYRLPSQSPKPARGKAPNPTPRDSHREWHCDSERKSLPRNQRPVPQRGTFTNKFGTFGRTDVRRTQGFGEWAPPAVCVVSWDPFENAKAEVPTWATHNKQGVRQEFQRQRLVGDHLRSGTVRSDRRRGDTTTRRRSHSAMDCKTADARLSVGGGRLSADVVERESVDLIPADQLMATPSATSVGAKCVIGTQDVPTPGRLSSRSALSHRVSPQQRPPTSNTLEPISAPPGFNFAPQTPLRPATSDVKSKNDRLDELMEQMIEENELKIVDLQTRIDATVSRATAPWPWADADMTRTAIGPRY